MSAGAHTGEEAGLVAWQVGRAPREPWRVSSRCGFGYPSTITSPSRLDDGTPFPNLVWLTCPWLASLVSADESAGMVAEWSAKAASDAVLAEDLRRVDALVREARAAESGGTDACAAVGVAGQRDPLGVKCLHAHVALALAGMDDPIGTELLGRWGETCADERCAAYAHARGEDS